MDNEVPFPPEINQPSDLPQTNTIQTGNTNVQVVNEPVSNQQNNNQVGQVNFAPPQQDNNNFNQNNNNNNFNNQNNNNNFNQNQNNNNNNFNQNNNNNFNNQNMNGGYQNNTQENKYKIFDLCWLLNPKIEQNVNLESSEAQFITIGYNIDYSNLRISTFNIPQGAIVGHVAFWSKLQRLQTATIYPSSCLRLLVERECSFTALEQLFNDTGADWQRNRPMCSFVKNETIVRMKIQDPQNGNSFYDFSGWQYAALMEACRFVKNEGLALSGRNKLN